MKNGNKTLHLNILEERLNRQMERGNMFMHTKASEQAVRINEIESFLFGMIDLMVEEGVFSEKEIKEKVAKVRDEMVEKNEIVNPKIAIRQDVNSNGTDEPKVEINCAERLHLCKAVCCQLNFALNVEEVESGKVKWDMGRPYFIRQESNCYCTHVNEEKQCGVYEDRPKVCRDYSCASDERIWTNFEAMELNEAWISENIQETKMFFKGNNMFPDEQRIDKLT